MNTKANALILLILVVFLIAILLVAYALYTTQQQPSGNGNSTVTLQPSPAPTPSQEPQETKQANLTANTTSINWGTVYKGETYTSTILLSNIGNATTNPLNMTSTCNIGTLTWNAEGTRINAPNDQRNATFTLTVWQNATTGPFNFSITVTY